MARPGGEAVQDIRFARSADGVGIAYAVHGSGPPLLIDACWLSHLQFDRQSPVWRVSYASGAIAASWSDVWLRVGADVAQGSSFLRW